MEQRKKVILIAGAGILVIALIIIFFVMSEVKRVEQEKADNEITPVETIIGQEDADTNNIIVTLPSDQEKLAVSVRAVATTFVERFGSYSNQSEYAGFEELASIMTQSMASWVKNTYLPQLKKEHDPKGYFYSIKTSAPVVEISVEEENFVEIIVKTQRLEKTDNSSQTFNQDIVLELVKQDGEWAIDGAFWRDQD
ncbi:hypothetical protein HN858_01455 [Candidatus Falkowbacteria bacterium]|jgi:hypothetical protein|nr:hypothetical protein [Candidatus Falkowbacteria bacterium]MBT5503155.1 hypothetical protein [Candidatus Falkowbacteria bacterium]MBT6574543.1 hypothetical protein [Candidatus Falkowbacteria bacterium]MBT7348320.1 hypothetical protein [Candidatus Falkowbacteria bacterium]MBT7500880.1 hypothetical protein [Candidatus Falkowbacteria bacterium]